MGLTCQYRRWYFRPDIALVTGYEYDKITTWNVGLRFAF